MEEAPRASMAGAPRASLKTINTNWKQKLRETCCRRIRDDRSRLLWRMRSLRNNNINHFSSSSLTDQASPPLTYSSFYYFYQVIVYQIRNEEQSSMHRPSPSPLPFTSYRANDNFTFEFENDNSYLGDKANDDGGEKGEHDPHSGRRNEALLPVQYDVAGPDPRTPNFDRNDSGRRISLRETKGARRTSYYGLTTVLKVQKGQKKKKVKKGQKKKGKE